MDAKEKPIPVTVKTPGGVNFPVEQILDRYEINRTRKIKQIVPVFNDTFLDYIAEAIRECIGHKFDCYVLVSGPRRTGKSTLTLQIAKRLDPNFSVNQVAFKLEEFDNILDKNPIGDAKKNLFPQAMLDEAGYDLFRQNWMEKAQKNLNRKIQVIGAKYQTIYLVVPNKNLLNTQIGEEAARFWIDMEDIEYARGLASFWTSKYNRWDIKKWWMPRGAFTFKDFEHDPIWSEYSKKKSAFINEVNAGEYGQIKTVEKTAELRRQRNILLRSLALKTKTTQDEIASITGIDRSVVSRILTKQES